MKKQQVTVGSLHLGNADRFTKACAIVFFFSSLLELSPTRGRGYIVWMMRCGIRLFAGIIPFYPYFIRAQGLTQKQKLGTISVIDLS